MNERSDPFGASRGADLHGVRIAFHLPSLEAGGAEKQLALLIGGLARRGVEAHVITFREGGPYWRSLAANPAIRLVSLDRRGRVDFGVVARLRRYLAAHRIDLVQGWMPPCNGFSAVAAATCGIPSVMAIRTASTSYGSAGSRFYTRLEAALGRAMSFRIVCNSAEGTKAYARAGYPAAKLCCIPNGLDAPASRVWRRPFDGEQVVRIGCLARIDPLKGHADLIDAVAALVRSGEDIHLDIFGDGPEPLASGLRGLALRQGIGDRVTWHGTVADVWSALDGVDVVVSASTVEGMSNSVLEAMAAGRVVVATDVGDNRRLLRRASEPCGYLCAPGDAGSLAAALRAVLGDRTGAVRLAQAAQQRCRIQFGVEAMVDRYQALYACALGIAPACGPDHSTARS